MPIRVKLPNGEIGEFPDDMPHEEIESVLQKQFPPEQQSEIAATPFNDRPAPKPERTGFKGIGSDALEALGHQLRRMRNIPSSLEKSGKYIEENPGSSILHNLGQMAVGAAELGKGIINAPHDLNQYLAKKEILPEWAGKAGQLIPHIPEDTGIEKALGLEADPEKGDEVFRAIPDVAGLAAGGASLIGKGKKLFKAPDLKQAIRDTQAKVNTATKNSGKVFDKIETTLDESGKNIVTVDKDLIEQAKAMLSKKFDNLIEKARGGDYKALRKLQSALGAKERKGLASDNLADVDMAENIGVVRNDINSAIEKHLDTNGFDDLAKELKKTRSDYRDIKQTYFSSPQLAKVFGKSQKVPKNPLTLLTEESAEMKKFFDAHPEVEKMMQKALKYNTKKKIALGALATIGGGATAGGTYKILGGH